MNKWDHRFLDLAELVGSWSKDPSTKVGSCLVDDKQRIISVGFNGPPRGVKDDRLHDREVKYRHIIHSEVNSLLFAARSVEGATCYVHPLPPCAACTSKLIQSGIAKIVAPVPNEEYFCRMGADIALAYALLQEAGVEFVPVQIEESAHSLMMVKEFYRGCNSFNRFRKPRP